MSDNRSVIQRYAEEVWNQGKVDVLDQICSPDYVEYDPTYPGGKLNRDGIKQVIAMFRRAFPDLRFSKADQIVEGDKVALYWKVSGTFLGQLGDQPPTGRSGQGDGVTLFWLRDGKLTEGRAFLSPKFRQEVGYRSPAEAAATKAG